MDISNKTKSELILELEQLQAKYDLLEKSKRNLEKGKNEKIKSLFNIFPIPVSECDFSLVRKYFDELKQNGIDDIKLYLKNLPNKRELVVKLAKMVDIVDLNEAHYNLYGVTKEQYPMVVDYLYDSYTTENIEEYINQFIALAEGNLSYVQSMPPHKTIGGELKYVISYLQVDPNYQHDLSRVYVLYIDVTEQKLAEYALIESEITLQELNKDKDRFISILAHDLRSPFNSILGLLNILITDFRTCDTDAIELQLKAINTSAQHTYNLLEDILFWIRTQSGKLPFEPENQNIGDTIEEVMKESMLHAESKNIEINLLGDRDIIVCADSNMVKTVLRNLISNAIKFTNKKGAINLYLAHNESHATIKVSDNGIGMSSKMIAQLFDISQIFTSAGTEREKGTGLGLVICKEFIEIHKGEISIESMPGSGCDVSFTLPLAN